MSVRYYVAPLAGDGTENDPYRPALPDVYDWVALIPSDPGGQPHSNWALCLVDADDHSRLEADSTLHALPLAPETRMSTLPQNLRSQYTNRLRQAGFNITIDWSTDTAVDVVDKLAASAGEADARGGTALHGRGW